MTAFSLCWFSICLLSYFNSISWTAQYMISSKNFQSEWLVSLVYIWQKCRGEGPQLQAILTYVECLIGAENMHIDTDQWCINKLKGRACICYCLKFVMPVRINFGLETKSAPMVFFAYTTFQNVRIRVWQGSHWQMSLLRISDGWKPGRLCTCLEIKLEMDARDIIVYIFPGRNSIFWFPYSSDVKDR